MLVDLIKKLAELKPSSEDANTILPDTFMQNKQINSDPRNIINDKGDITGYDTNDWSKSNPFSAAISKSRENNDTGPGVLKQLLSSILGGGLVQNTGKVGGGGEPDHVPGTRQDAALNPQPLKEQKQPNLTPVPLPQPRQDYSMPTALDPNSIEELRRSLLSDAGQLDPNNPNGLAGRMTGPYANVEQETQMKEGQSISDQFAVKSGKNQWPRKGTK